MSICIPKKSDCSCTDKQLHDAVLNLFSVLPLSLQIGSIKLDKFVARTQPDVASAVQRLIADGAEELVLDLRNNLGGLVEEGVEVARLFLDGKLPLPAAAATLLTETNIYCFLSPSKIRLSPCQICKPAFTLIASFLQRQSRGTTSFRLSILNNLIKHDSQPLWKFILVSNQNDILSCSY